MFILGPSNSGLKKLINIQKCPSSTKLNQCAFTGFIKGQLVPNMFWQQH